MLIEKPFSDGDVVSLKLTSGEEVVARFRSDTEQSITIEQPMTLVNTPQGIGLMPYMFTVEEGQELKLPKSSIVVNTHTRSETASDYLSRTTGLQMVS